MHIYILEAHLKSFDGKLGLTECQGDPIWWKTGTNAGPKQAFRCLDMILFWLVIINICAIRDECQRHKAQLNQLKTDINLL